MEIPAPWGVVLGSEGLFPPYPHPCSLLTSHTGLPWPSKSRQWQYALKVPITSKQSGAQGFPVLCTAKILIKKKKANY